MNLDERADGMAHRFKRLKRTNMSSLWSLASLTEADVFTESELVDSGDTPTQLIEEPQLGFCDSQERLVAATQFTCVHSQEPVMVAIFVYGKILLIISDGFSSSRWCELEYPSLGESIAIRSYPIFRKITNCDNDEVAQQVLEDLVVARTNDGLQLTTDCVVWCDDKS